MIIDIHPHIISDDTAAYPINPIGGKRSEWSAKGGFLTAEQLVAAMKEAGIDKSVVVHSSTTYGFDNSYVADSIVRYPNLLLGVGSVDFMADNALEKLRYWVENRSLHGLRLFTRGTTMAQAMWVDDPQTFPAWEWVQERDIPVCVQITASGLPMLCNIMKRYPGIKIILDHATAPALDDGPPYAGLKDVLPLSDYPQVFIKVTTDNFRKISMGKSTSAQFMEILRSAFGAERLAWGSNFPASEGSLVSHVEMAMAAIAGFSQKERDAFLCTTARKLYPL